MPVVEADTLGRIVSSILIAVGASRANAERVAEALVSSNLSGVDTHGVLHLPKYVADVEAGKIAATASPAVLKETPSTALVSGEWTFGHVAAKYSIDLAIWKARSQGVGLVSTVACNHIGRLGEYAEMTAAAGMVGIICGSGYGVDDPAAAPYGGSKGLLHTNPIAGGFPGGGSGPITFDFATTTMSGSKLILASRGLIDVVPGAVVDREGSPTTDPAKFLDGGAHLPFGGHKGYGLMVAVEVLGRLLSGADDYVDGKLGSRAMRHQGVTMIVLQADLFRPMADFTSGVEALIGDLRGAEPGQGFDEVLAPGDPEKRARERRSAEGIPVPDEVWGPLRELAERQGVSVT